MRKPKKIKAPKKAKFEKVGTEKLPGNQKPPDEVVKLGTSSPAPQMFRDPDTHKVTDVDPSKVEEPDPHKVREDDIKRSVDQKIELAHHSDEAVVAAGLPLKCDERLVGIIAAVPADGASGTVGWVTARRIEAAIQGHRRK